MQIRQGFARQFYLQEVNEAICLLRLPPKSQADRQSPPGSGAGVSVTLPAEQGERGPLRVAR